jgi:nucleolar protein 15
MCDVNRSWCSSSDCLEVPCWELGHAASSLYTLLIGYIAGANKRFKKIPRNKIEGHKLKKPLTESRWAAKISAENKKRSDKAKKLQDMGYEFEAPQLKSAIVAHDDGPEGVQALETAAEEAPKALEAAPASADKAIASKETADVDVGDGVETLDSEVVVKKSSKVAKAGAKTKKAAKKTPKAKKAKL